MLLLQNHEKDYLLSLNALFLMNDSSPTKTSEQNDFTEVGGKYNFYGSLIYNSIVKGTREFG